VDCDVIIVGGGPAGASAARFLALRGHSVLLLTRGPAYGIAESLPPSIQKLLHRLQLLDAVDAAGFLRSTGNTVRWGREPVRVESFPEGERGYQVLRPALDRLLLREGERAGARVVPAATVRQLEGISAKWPDLSAGVRAVWEQDGKEQTATAHWVLDCSGRTGVLARRGFRTVPEGRNTVALAGSWETDRGWGFPDPTHTVVESFEQGWAWSIPVSDLVRHVAVMVDPQPDDRGPLADRYRQLLRGCPLIESSLAGAVLTGDPRALAAAPYGATRFAGPHWLLVGDAASFIDPLSSFGVKKALASAWLAGVVVHTALTDADMTAAALELYDLREREAHDRFTSHAAQFYSLTRGAVPTLEGNDDGDVLVVDWRAVASALERVRRFPALRLRPTSRARTELRPAVAGDRVILEPRLIADWGPGGMRFHREVDLPQLIALAPECSSVPDLYRGYQQRAGGVPLPAFLEGLALVVARGALEQRESD
jgi:halogenation protein CepH